MSWNEFQHSVGGKGYDKPKISALYTAHKCQAEEQPPTPSRDAGGALSWNEFQHSVAGRGLSKAEISTMYRDQKRG